MGIALAVHKQTGLPFAEGLNTTEDLPHNLTYAIMYNARIESFGELPKDKRPPRYMWDRPHQLDEYLSHVWDRDDGSGNSGDTKFRKSNSYEFTVEDVE